MSKFDTRTELKRVALGAMLGALVTMAMAATFTMFLALPVASGKMGEGTERAIVIGSAFAASVLGALTARLKNHGAALLSGALTALLAILLRFLVGLACGCESLVDGGDVAVLLSILCGGLATGAISAHPRRKRR